MSSRLTAVLLSFILAVPALAADAAAPQAAKPAAPSRPNIAGTWSSPRCEPGANGQGFTRTFKNTATTWSIDFTLYASPTCNPAQKIFTVFTDGPYKLGNPSPAVQGATEGEFLIAHRWLTPRSREAVKSLNDSKACGAADWKLNTPRDLSRAGCSSMNIQPVSACKGEYDVVKVEAKSLYFGQRPADGNLCEPSRRPTSLAAPVVRK